MAAVSRLDEKHESLQGSLRRLLRELRRGPEYYYRLNVYDVIEKLERFKQDEQSLYELYLRQHADYEIQIRNRDKQIRQIRGEQDSQVAALKRALDQRNQDLALERRAHSDSREQLELVKKTLRYERSQNERAFSQGALHDLRFHHADLRSDLKAAILKGSTAKVRAASTYDKTHITALHLAALCGEPDIARDLLRAGARANGYCDTPSANGHVCHGVTPMHLAALSHDTAMISVLRESDASFEYVRLASGRKTTAPAAWALSRRWVLRLPVHMRTPERMLETLRHMKAAGWDPRRPMNSEGRSFPDFVREELKEWQALRQAVMDWLPEPSRPVRYGRRAH